MRRQVVELALGKDNESFELEKAVCNYGFFMMSPNGWDASARSLRRPLRLSDAATSVDVSISHASDRPSLLISISTPIFRPLSVDDQRAIIEQVSRMLRISHKDESDVREFWNLHVSAKEKGFGRLFRSPSLFEDFVKSVLLCATRWSRTLTMAKLLCNLQADLTNGLIAPEHFENEKAYTAKRRKRKWSVVSKSKSVKETKSYEMSEPVKDDESNGNFPNARELAGLKVKFLQEQCKLGYRAEVISNLAKMIENGKLELQELEKVSSAEAYARMIQLPGVGDFVCSNMLMCMGYYHKIPVDSETLRHIDKIHSRKSCKKMIEKDLEEIYGKFGAFRCLAYWFELLEDYEKNIGKLSELHVSKYSIVSGSCFRHTRS